MRDWVGIGSGTRVRVVYRDMDRVGIQERGRGQCQVLGQGSTSGQDS